jgi:uncharacterized protein YbbC (DUF1343 family)
MRVKVGVETLLDGQRDLLRGKTIGVICNQASVGPGFQHTVDLLNTIEGVRIGALLGPEHGVRGEAQDMIAVKDGGSEGARDRRTGAPVHSLYGATYESLTPTRQMLQGLDVLVFDMQDVGARYYTFYATMVLAMQAAAAEGLTFVVLDRPNPLGGEQLEGGFQHDDYCSFVGLFPLPVRHGMTVGELALYANDQLGIGCTLHVVPMTGWSRAMYWEQTGLPFVPPSPNMPTPDTALVYPGMCLVEGTLLSEARGTTRPFEQSGAPWLDPDRLAEALNGQKLPGVHFRPCWFRPTFHKFAGHDCGAVFLHVTDRTVFEPYRAGLAFVEAAQAQSRQAFCWRTERYEFVDSIPAFDLLTGSAEVRQRFDSGQPIDDVVGRWHEEVARFRQKRAPFLLY